MPVDHPLRRVRALVDAALRHMSPQFSALYARSGRPSIAPEKLLRALLLRFFYSVRGERLLMVQLQYNLRFRWFVGLSMDDAVWDVTVFTKNRERLLEGLRAMQVIPSIAEHAKESWQWPNWLTRSESRSRRFAGGVHLRHMRTTVNTKENWL
jgi:transposase